MDDRKLLEAVVTLSAMQVQLLAEIKSIALRHTKQPEDQHSFRLLGVADHVRQECANVIRAACGEN